MLQSCFHLLPFGGIEHQRQLDVGYETRCELMHIALAIAANEINVHVQHVSALAFLVLGQQNKAVPIFHVQKIAHFLRATCIDALADD